MGTVATEQFGDVGQSVQRLVRSGNTINGLKYIAATHRAIASIENKKRGPCPLPT